MKMSSGHRWSCDGPVWACLWASDIRRSIAADKEFLKILSVLLLVAINRRLTFTLLRVWKYPEGHAPLFTNQKKLLFQYGAEANGLVALLQTLKVIDFFPTDMSIINVKDEHAAAAYYISLEMCTDTAWFIKNKHPILRL